MEKLFENQGTLGLFLIFFIPGFITLKVYDLLIPGEPRDFSKSLFDAIAYSSLNFRIFLVDSNCAIRQAGALAMVPGNVLPAHRHARSLAVLVFAKPQGPSGGGAFR